MLIVASDEVKEVSWMFIAVVSTDMWNSVSSDMVVVYKIHDCFLCSFEVVTAVVGVPNFHQLPLFVGDGVSCGCDRKLELLVAVMSCFNDHLQFVNCWSTASLGKF